VTGPRAGGVRLERSRGGQRADLSIEIPPLNVLDADALAALAAQVAAAPAARLLVLHGLPRAFSAGVDVAAHAPEPVAIEEMLSAMRRVLAALCETPAVTLASVSGACLGGGAEIVSACDLVLVAEDARIGFPEIRLACFPPGAAHPAGPHQARAAGGFSRARPTPAGRPEQDSPRAVEAAPRGRDGTFQASAGASAPRCRRA
jgi:enoyl-CoA hydratase/carnithine racemase